MRRLALVALLLAATASAGPAVPTSRETLKCAGYCKGSSKFNYDVGSTYTYVYSADTVTSVSGAGDENSRLHLTASVEIHAVSPCDFTMQLHSVHLKDSVEDTVPRLSEFSSALERHSLLFSFQDGAVDELCATSADPVWVLNIKRGVLTAFQNSMNNLQTSHKLFETDVTGVCETEYSVEDTSGTNTVVRKTKNLLACGHRMDHFLSLQSTPYSSESHARSLPLVKSDHECVQTYKSGLLMQAMCMESHLFRPFSNGDNGAVTRVTQKLEYVHHAAGSPPTSAGGARTRTTLLFQHTAEEVTTDTRATTIVNSLEELERKTRNGIQSDTPKVFAQLVATLKSTSYPTLAKVFSRTRQQHTRKFLLDAMPLVGTADGLTVMTDLYKSGEITDSEMDSWLTSLTFLKRPTITMLLAVSSLLDGEPRPKAVLGLSSLVHSYCQTDSECHEKEPVRDYLLRMEKLLGDGCHVKGRTDMELKILALKGIGNMGVPPTSLNTIAKCYLHPENPLEVRLAAIGAHRRLPCASAWTTSLLQTYTNMQLDTEMRIAAYLTVMQCPSAVILAKVKETLYSEEVNQVASFVWTHLTNIQESSSRWKQNIKDLITSDFLQNKFHTDARKFSRNYEGSLFVDSLNTGVTVDSNIIFTPQSYLPRSASLNLTLDLFGESINVFEVGSRAEGFEMIVEDMFGPRGYFPDKSLKKVLQNARLKRGDDMENSIDQLAEIFDANSKLNVEPQASMYARVFGNEIHYSRYQGLSELTGGHPHLDNPLAAISKILGGQDVDYTNSFVFLDASYRFPTAVGLSLELSVNGSATIGLKASGHIDLSHSSIEVQGKIAPSAAVRVVGTMTVDGVITKAGLRSVSQLHTNTYMEGHAIVRGKSLVDVKLNVPREKVEVLEVTSKIFVLRREIDLEVAGIMEERELSTGCSSELFSQITGMQLCTELAYPNASHNEVAPHFPLTGPVTLRLNLLKTDTFDSYILNFQQLSQADGDVRTMKLQFDTPNSHIDRKIVTFLSLDQQNAAVKGSLQTPFIKLDVNGKVDFDENFKAVDFTLHMNDKTLFATKAAVKISNKGHLRRYEPTLSMVIHNIVDLGLTGKVNYVEGTKYSADFTMTGLTNTPLLFSADLNCEGNKYDMVGSIQSPLVQGSIHANLRQTNSYVNTKVTVEYSVHKGITETVNLSGKIQSSYKKALQKNSVYGSLQMSALPQYNLLVRWDRVSGENYAEYNGRFGLGKTEWLTKQLYRLHARGSDDIYFTVLSHLACPSKDVDYKAEVQYKTTDSSIATHVLAQLSQQHKFYSALNFQSLDERQEFAVEVSSPWYMTSLKGDVVEREPGNFVTQVEGRYEVMGLQGVSNVQSLVMHSTYIDASTETRQDQKLSVELSGIWAAVLNGELTSEAGSSKVWAQFDVQGKKYSADITHAQNGVSNHIIHTTVHLVDRTYRSKAVLQHSDFETAFSVDVQLSKRLVLSTKTFNDGVTQGVEFELLWDKDEDPSRRIAMVVHSNNVKREALLEFPGQYVKAELVTLPKRVSALLEWAEDQKINMNVEWNIERDGINGTARLTTPFPGIESQSMSANYKYNAKVIRTEIDLAWQDEKLMLTVDGMNSNFVQLVDDKPVTSTKYEVKTKLTSTLKSISDISANYEHQNSMHAHSQSITVVLNTKRILSSSLTRQSSELKADVYFDSPFKSIPSIQGKVLRSNTVLEGSKHIMELQIGSNKKLVTEFTINQDSTKTGLFHLMTPYEGFKNTTANFVFSNIGDDLNLIVGLEQDSTLKADFVLASKTSELMLGSGSLITPFTKPLQVGFTHSLKSGLLKEGISLTVDDKHVLLGSVVGSFDSPSDFKLTTDLSLPSYSHSLITKLDNKIGAAGVMMEFEGLWNGDRVASSLLVGNHKVLLTATASDLRTKQEVHFVFNHTRVPGVNYLTDLKLHKYLLVSHKLSIENSANWENTIYTKISENEGQITNKQSFKRQTLEFVHLMNVGWNEPQATLKLAFSLDGNSWWHFVKTAEGLLTTPWTHPVTFVFDLPITDKSFSPQLKLQYQENKEIVVESLIQFETMTVRVQLDVKSPYCKPIHLNAFCDISLPTKAALMTLKWEENQFDFKSTVHLEYQKATGVIVLTRSDMDGQYINAQFKYDTSRMEDMTGHLTVAYKDVKMGVGLTGSITNYIVKGDCEITTPFSDWEKITASLNLDRSKPTKVGTVTVGRNKESVALLVSAQFTGPWLLSTVFTSTIPSLRNVSMSASLEASQGHHLVKLSCDCGGRKTQLVATLKTGADLGMVEVSLQSPFNGMEDLFGRASYVGKPGDKSMGLVVRRNTWKVQVDANCLWKQNTTGEVSLIFQSPFEGLENVSGLLKHTMKTEPINQITTDILLTRNNEKVEMATSVSMSLDEVTMKVQCKTPINKFKLVTGDFSIKQTPSQKSLEISLTTNDERIEANADLKVGKPWNAAGNLHITTPFQGYEALSAGFDYNLQDSLVDGKAKVFLDVLDEMNLIEVELNYLPSTHKSSVKAIVKLPIVSIGNINIDGKLDTKLQHMDLQGMVDEQFMSLHAELLPNSLDTSMLSSINGYERLNFSSFFTLTTDKKVARVLFARNDAEFIVSATAVVDYLASELHIASTTPINQWQKLNIDAKYDVGKTKKNLQFSLTKLDEQYGTKVEWGVKGDEGAEFNIIINSPIHGFRTVKVSADYYLTHTFSAKALLQTDMHKIEGSIIASDKDLKIVLDTPLEQIKHLELVGNYNLDGKDKSVVVRMERNKEEIEFDINLATTIESTSITVNTPFSSCRTFLLQLTHDAKNKAFALDMFKNSVKLAQISGIMLDLKSRAGFNFNAALPAIAPDELTVEAWYTTENKQKKVTFHIYKNSATVAELTSYISLVQDDGFEYVMKVSGGMLDVSRRTLEIEVHLKDSLVKSLLTYMNEDSEDRYAAKLVFDNTSLIISLSSPVEGYEDFSLHVEKSADLLAVDLNTSFFYYDTMKLSGQISNENNQENFVSFSTVKNQETFAIDWKLQYDSLYAKSSFVLASPLSLYESFSVKGEYDLRSQLKSLTLALDRNYHSVEIISMLALKGKLLAESSVNVTTSIPDLRNIRLFGSVDLNEQSHKSLSFSGYLNDARQVEIKFDSESGPNKANFALVSITPYYESSFEAKGSYDFTNPSKLLSVNGLVSVLDVAVNVSAIMQDNSKRGELHGTFGKAKVHYDGKLSWHVENDKKQKKARVTLDLGDKKQVEVVASVNVDGWNNVKTLVNLTDHFSHRYAITADWSVVKEEIKSKFGFQWNNNEVALESLVELRELHNSANIKFTSPYKNFEEIILQSTWTRGNSYEFSSLLQWKKDKKVVLNVLHPVSQFQVKLDTPYTSPLSLSVKYLLTTSSSDLHSTVLGSLNYGKWKNELKATFELGENNNVGLTLLTPIYGVKSIQLNGKFQFDVIQSEALLALEIDSQKWQLSGIMHTHENKSDVGIKLSTPLQSFKEGQLLASYDLSNGYSAHLSVQQNEDTLLNGTIVILGSSAMLDLRTALEGIELISAEYRLDIEGEVGQLVAQSDFNGKKTEFQAKLNVQSDKVVAEVELKSPWSQDFSLHGVYNKKDTHAMKMTLRRGEQVTEVLGYLGYLSEDSKVEVEFESIVEGYGSMSGKAGYDGQKPLKTAQLNVRVGETEFHARAQGKVSRDGIVGDLHIDTPADSLKLLEVKVQLEKTGSVVALINDKKYQLHYTTSVSARSISGRVSASSPEYELQNVAVDLKYGDNFLTFNGEINGERADFESVFQFDKLRSTLTTKLQVPIVPALAHIELSYSLDLIRPVFVSKVQWSATEKINIESKLLVNDFRLSIETPFKNLQRMDVSSQITAINDVYSLVSMADWDGLKMDFDGNAQMEPLDVSLTFQTEWEDGQTTSIRTEISNKEDKISAHSVGTVHGKQINVVAEIDKANFVAKLNVDIPFLDIVPMYAEAQLKNDQWRTCEVEVRVSLPKISYKALANYAVTNTELKAGLDLDVPFIKSSLVFGGSYSNVNLTEMETVIYINDNKISASYEITNKVFTGALDVNVPDLGITAKRIDLQTSLVFNPEIQATLTYRSNNYNGSLSGSVLKLNDGISLRVDLEFPQFLGPLTHTARIGVKYLGPQRFVEVRLDNGRSTQSASLEINKSGSDLSVAGRVSGPSVGDKEVIVVVQNNLQLLSVNIFNLLTIEMKHDVTSGSVAVNYAGKEHKVLYKVSRNMAGFDASLELESVLLRDRNVNLRISSEIKGKIARVLVNCNVGRFSSEAAMELVNELQKKSVSLTLVQASQTLVKVSISKQLQGNFVENEALLEWSNSQHTALLRYSPTGPINVNFGVSSPLLPDELLEVKLSIQDTSITAYAGIGEKALNQFMELNADLNIEENTANFGFQAPCCNFVTTLTVNGVFKVSKQKIHLSLDGHFSSKLITDSEISTKFILSKNGLDASVLVKTPFLEFRQFETTVQIPFTFTKKYDLKMLLSLPTGMKYSAHAQMHRSVRALEVSAGIEYNTHKVSGLLKLLRDPVLAMDFQLDTPFKGLKHYQVQLRGQRNLVDGDDIVNYVEWGNQKIELRHSTIFTGKKFDYRIQLTTPFKNYERYVAGLQLEFDIYKKVLAVLGLPGMETDWTIEFDFRFNDLTDSSFLVNVHMPIFSGFKTASLLIGSKYDSEKVSYRGVVSANYNQYEFITTFDGIFEEIGLKVDFNTQLDSNKINAQFVGGFHDNGMIFGGFEIETPFSHLKSGKFSLQMFPYELRRLQANINLNSVELVYVNVIESEPNKRTIVVKTPWRSVSVAYSLYIRRNINVWGEVCWDLNNKLTSQLGAEFVVTSGTESKTLSMSMALKLPTRDMSFNYTRRHEFLSFEYSTMVSWEADKVIGYRVFYEHDSKSKSSALVRLDLPFRAFELTSQVDLHRVSVGGLGAQFIWDAALDRSKQMGMSLTWTPDNAEFSLNHAAFTHSLALRIEQENCLVFNPEQPRTVKLVLQYSPLPRDLIIMGVLHRGVWEDRSGVEMFFSLRHDASNLDHSILLSAIQTSEHSTAKLGVNYKKPVSGEKRTLEIYAKLRNDQPDIMVAIQDTNNKLSFIGSLWTKENCYRGFTTQLGMNQKEPLRVEGQINVQEVSSELDISYGANRGYTFSAGMPTPRLISAGITRKLYGLPATDAQVTLKLNTSRLLWTQVKWQPGMLEKMQLSLFKEYNDISLVAQSVVDSFSELFDEDLLGRLVTACTAVCTDMSVDIGDYTQKEMQLIREDFREAIEAASSMYRRNEFYIKDIHQSLSSAISYVHEKSVCILKRVLQLTEGSYSAVKQLFGLVFETLHVDFSQIIYFFREIQALAINMSQHMVEVAMDLQQLSTSLRSTAKDLLVALREGIAQTDQNVKEMFVKVKDYWGDLVVKGATSFQPHIVAIQRYSILLHNSLVAIENSITEMAQTVVNTIMAVKELEDLAILYDEYSGWLEELQVQEYVDRVWVYLNVVGEILIEDFNRMFAEYKETIDATLNLMSGQVERMDRVPAVAYVKDVTNTVYEKMSWLWRYYNVSKHLELYLEGILNSLDEIVAQLLHSVDMDPKPRPHSMRRLVVRPGFLEVSQRLPVEWESFHHWPEFSQFTAPSSSDMAGVDGYHTYLTAALSKFSPNLAEASLLPPFGTTGIIAGKQHFITFDNYFYDFVGECSYLLASDFLDNKYSVVVNYEFTDTNVVKKSLTVISDDRHIDISANYQVTVDSKRIELPAVIGNNIVLSRFGNRLIVDIESNMAIECNLVYDICTVQLTGWNFGKTGGLLGTFDNEPLNDVSLPNGTVTTDLERFASSWRVGNSSRCRAVNHAIIPPASDDAIDACDAYFTDLNSPLSACYASIDPMPYYHMCISDMTRVTDVAGVCSAAVAYATLCRRAGLEAILPQECVQCRLPNTPTLLVGESKVLNGGVPLSADIVFVVEQGPCIKGANLAKTATKLDAALLQQGLVDNRFSVVGFGGDTFPQAHSRTAKGEIWTSGRGVEKAFAGLVLGDGQTARNEQDVYDALRFASRLSFRGGVSKTIVLVQCSACDSQLDYGNMMGLLLENDITLHLLEPSAILLRDTSIRTNSKVFGADLSGVYTARNGKNTKPNASLLKQMILPKDHCSPLAFETNGTVFNLEGMSNAAKQAVSLKKFADVWSRRVAHSARPSPCQKCECVASEDGVGQVQCSTCVTASVDQFLLDWQTLLTEDYIHTRVVTAEKSDEEDS